VDRDEKKRRKVMTSGRSVRARAVSVEHGSSLRPSGDSGDDARRNPREGLRPISFAIVSLALLAVGVWYLADERPLDGAIWLMWGLLLGAFAMWIPFSLRIRPKETRPREFLGQPFLKLSFAVGFGAAGICQLGFTWVVVRRGGPELLFLPLYLSLAGYGLWIPVQVARATIRFRRLVPSFASSGFSMASDPDTGSPTLQRARISWSPGAPTVIAVWAPWSPECRALLPVLAEVMEGFPSVRFLTIATAIDAHPGPLPSEYLATARLTCPVLLDDAERTLARALRVVSYPVVLFVKSDGSAARVKDKEPSTAELRRRVQDVL
jgi:thiol-disulfide isomerase/thioredoxin